MTLTSEQVKAARQLLGWSVRSCRSRRCEHQNRLGFRVGQAKAFRAQSRSSSRRPRIGRRDLRGGERGRAGREVKEGDASLSFSHRNLVSPLAVKARTNVKHCARHTLRATYYEYGRLQAPEWEKALFRDALAIAQGFTLPVLLSRKTVSGKCEGSIGTCVVINRDGWIVTVGHILRQWDKLQSDTERQGIHNPRKSAIENDPTIDRYERKRRIIALGQISQDDTDQCSAFWGVPGPPL